jgi:hypothetical protein
MVKYSKIVTAKRRSFKMWIDEYIRLQFPLNPDEMRIDRASELKDTYIPNSLFRYRSFNEYSLENLKNQQERMSYPIEFNDPFDAGLKINYEVITNELFINRNLHNMIEELKENGVSITEKEEKGIRESKDPFFSFAKHMAQFDDNSSSRREEIAEAIYGVVLNQTKNMFDSIRTGFQTGYLVICFSESNDIVLMWSHYAQYHTGFCIEYNFHELGPLHPRNRTLFPLIYTDELFDATQYILQIFMPTGFNNLFGIYPTIRKSTNWAYEKEWRNVFPNGPNASNEQRLTNMPKPKALYLGAKASLESNCNRKENSPLSDETCRR